MSLRWALTNHLTQAPKGCFTIKFPVLQLRAFSSRKPAGDVIKTFATKSLNSKEDDVTMGFHGNTDVTIPAVFDRLQQWHQDSATVSLTVSLTACGVSARVSATARR
uniref:Uncharacterized protein n=1 Tax=Xenopus tropicalis TaxID=8364 RepID=A0A1B8XVV2_XENTR